MCQYCYTSCMLQLRLEEMSCWTPDLYTLHLEQELIDLPIFIFKGPKPLFVKIQTLVYAKMSNMAILGLLKVVGAPLKSLLYVYIQNISKSKSQKSVF